jgi:hypothetical protein
LRLHCEQWDSFASDIKIKKAGYDDKKKSCVAVAEEKHE